MPKTIVFPIDVKPTAPCRHVVAMMPQMRSKTKNHKPRTTVNRIHQATGTPSIRGGHFHVMSAAARPNTIGFATTPTVTGSGLHVRPMRSTSACKASHHEATFAVCLNQNAVCLSSAAKLITPQNIFGASLRHPDLSKPRSDASRALLTPCLQALGYSSKKLSTHGQKVSSNHGST